MHDYDVAVIGGGPVGMWAACVCQMLDLKTVLIEASEFLGGQCATLYPEKPIFDIPGLPEVRSDELIRNLITQLDRFKPTILLGQWVKQIRKDEIQTDKATIRTRSTILSIGLGVPKPNKPTFNNIEQLELAGLIKYKFEKLELFDGKVCAVLGGGDTAADWVLQLAARAKIVHLIHRGARMSAIPSMRTKIDQIAKTGICRLHMEQTIREVNIVNDQAEIILNSGETIIVDYLVSCYGVRLDDAPIEADIKCMNGKILVDPITCASSNPLVCAIGDVCWYQNKRELLTVGFGDASKAAYYLMEELGGSIPGGYSTSWFKKV